MTARHSSTRQPPDQFDQNPPCLTLGTANFGERWGSGWRMKEDDAARLLHRAADLGIERLDTANVYNGGASEKMLGQLLSREGLRSRFKVATKFGYRTHATSAHAGGSSAKAMIKAVEASLQRLQTDRIDLFYLHLWDRVTPIEETLSAAATLVRQGKVRDFGLSNVPAWYLARADALCASVDLARISTVQLQYNLLMRHIEYEFRDVLDMVGCELVAWGPLADGLLSGKYQIDARQKRLVGRGRLEVAWQTTSSADPFDERVITTVSLLQDIQQETGHPAAQIALSWLSRRPRLSSVVVGVTSVFQLEQNIAAMSLDLDPAIYARLDAASRIQPNYPHNFLEPEVQVLVHGPNGVPNA